MTKSRIIIKEILKSQKIIQIKITQPEMKRKRKKKCKNKY